ncbi:MAG: NYN domain-containing protein [Ectothiorhodospiraceae bacterium]|nr:NYN domain-containing protein [Chromatiales bacterium]MCP5154037.1 NYN domain-containing protein [Ectothiorhodospiraceae bacterium]
MTTSLRAALFIDFDNVFSALREHDEQAAEYFVQEPLAWLDWFERGGHEVGARERDEDTPPAQRRVLLRRCYLNPQAFWRQRAGFVAAGFQVVDCPQLTTAGKNSADMVMALDIIETLAHETRFDEFLLLSGDADFAPVLLRLRAHDRRTALLANGRIASALRNSADIVVALDQFLSGALGIGPAAVDADEDTVVEHLRNRIREASEPSLLSALGANATATFGVGLREAGWFGHRSLSRLLRARLADEVAITGRHVYVPGQHAAPQPDAEPTDTDAATVLGPELDAVDAETIRQVCDATGSPLLSSASYRALFSALADVLATGARAQSDVVRLVRQYLDDEAVQVSPREIGFVFYGYHLGGHSYDALAGDATALAEAFRSNLRHRCSKRGLLLDDEQEAVIDDWLLGTPDEPPDASAAATVES